MKILTRAMALVDRLAALADRALAAALALAGRHTWTAAPLRAGLEAGLVMIGLLALVITPMRSAPVLVVPATLVLFSLLSGALAGVRIRLSGGRWYGALLREALWTLPLAAALTLISLGMLRLGGIPQGAAPGEMYRISIALGPGTCIPAFLTVRILARIGFWWNRLRKQHFVWALTHAQLTVVMLIGLLVSLVGLGLIVFTVQLELNQLASLPGIPPYSIFMQVIIWLLGLVFISLALTGAGILFLFPPAFVFAYLVGRGLTRRVETLARAAASLRAGDFSARVAVEGEDELAQLQVDFNQMAADLQQRTRQLEDRTQELQAERDRTAGLLNAHRQLAAAVSHELRTPVATARTYLDALLKNSPREPLETAWSDLEILSGEVGRLERLIDDLFALSRAEVDRLSLNISPLVLAPFLKALVAAAEKPAWEQRRVEVTLAEIPEGLAASADMLRLEQIIRNLIQNSLRHTPPGGYVLVSAKQIEAGAEVEIRVEDSGEGIDPSDLPHIWDRFYRSDAARQAGDGSGLGLALVKELTEAMGGSVGVQSCPGEGSVFWVRLPQPAACDTIAT